MSVENILKMTENYYQPWSAIHDFSSFLVWNGVGLYGVFWKICCGYNGRECFFSLSLIHPSSLGLFFFHSLSFIHSYDISASSQTSSNRLLRHPNHLLSLCLSLNLKCDVMLHLHLPCEKLDLSEAMEGWEKDLSTACERRDDLSVYICLVPQPRWGIDVVLRSWSESEMEKGYGRRWTREKSQAGRREVGIFRLFYHISRSAEWRLWIYSSDRLRCCSASWDAKTRARMTR